MRNISPISPAIVGLLLAALHGNSARAEVSVQGNVENVRLEASEATATEILTALGERFELRFHGTTASRRITAIYEGPLRRILARVLEGYDYVVERHGANLEVIVLSSGAPRAAVPPAPIVRRRAD